MDNFALQEDVVLAAALEFIDSFDSDSDTKTPPTAAASPRGAALKRPRTTSGQRARAEIQRLRGVVAELEGHVRHIKQRVYSADSGALMDASEVREWELLVARERRERQQAQSTNVQLRELVIKQMLVVRKLEKLVHRGRGVQENSSIARQMIAEQDEDGTAERNDPHARQTEASPFAPTNWLG